MDRSPDADSLCALMEQCSLSQKERARFNAQLVVFPHTFLLQNQECLSSVKIRRLKSGLESAFSVGYETGIETARGRNLLAYFLYQLNQPKAALEQLEMVLKMDDQKKNLVTLANKAAILWNQMHRSEADELVEYLNKMKTQDDEFPYLLVRAKAELAFSYTRLGPSFFTLAIAKFEEVIPKAREPEKWLWKFGLALTRRRLIRAQPQGISSMPSPESAAEQRDVLRLLMDIAKGSSSRSLKAKTYSEMALLLFGVSKTSLKEEFHSRAHMNAEQACEQALSLDSNDNSVLCKCARILRYLRQTKRSCELLEKALSIRPSSTAYHHLGITYKALACNEKYKRKVPGRQWQAGCERPHDDNTVPKQFQLTSAHECQVDGSAYARCRKLVGNEAVDATVNDLSPLSQNIEISIMQKNIKSPNKGVTSYSRDDMFIKEALENFKKAIKFSEGENTRALYDLAILQKSMGELEEAKETLQEMLKQQGCLFLADRVSIYEQTGLIMKELAEFETDEVTKAHMVQNSTTMLQRALTTAAEVFSKSPGVKEHLGELFISFSVLLQAVEESNKSTQKLQKKAKLFQLIRDHKQSLALLQEIQKMDPEKSEDPKHLKLCIEDYVALGQYETAITFVKLLKCTPHGTATIQLFEDSQYIMKINIHAALQALLANDLCSAKVYFRYAFTEASNAYLDDGNGSESGDTDTSEDSSSHAGAEDIAILHEETEESFANAALLTALLGNVCGLTVTGLENVPPNKPELQGELRILKRSTMVIVMAGGKTSRRNRFYIQNIAKQRSTVTLLVDGKRMPELLKGNRSMECPPEMLQRCDSAYNETQRAEAEVDTICTIFSFLVNVDLGLADASQ